MDNIFDSENELKLDLIELERLINLTKSENVKRQLDEFKLILKNNYKLKLLEEKEKLDCNIIKELSTSAIENFAWENLTDGFIRIIINLNQFDTQTKYSVDDISVLFKSNAVDIKILNKEANKQYQLKLTNLYSDIIQDKSSFTIIKNFNLIVMLKKQDISSKWIDLTKQTVYVTRIKYQLSSNDKIISIDKLRDMYEKGGETIKSALQNKIVSFKKIIQGKDNLNLLLSSKISNELNN